jgi:predicted  nucleic acid-binding Zn-ribbon protein
LAERDRDATAQQPSAAELLRAALDKIVFFEWRVSELAGEVAAAHRRCAAAETARAEAEEAARAAAAQAKSARMQCAEMEAEQARISALLSNPAQGRAAADANALDAERRRSAALASELDQARAELNRSRAERERWLTEMIAQARTGEEAPAALAQFISELRGEVIALRDHRNKCEAALAEAKVAVPAFEAFDPPAAPAPSPEPVDEGRRMWAEGRLAATAGPAPAAQFVLPAEAGGSAAARALADQCLRSLASGDPRRREQAARHLAAAPLPAAAPAIAAALSAETAPKARAELAKALAACGGDAAAEIVARLQGEGEPPLVRLAALDALCAMPQRARAAIEVAARDGTAAVRRRAAALAVLERLDDLAARFAADEDGTVRSALAAARSEAPVPVAAKPPPAVPARQEGVATVPAAPRPRDPVRAALQRLVLEGGSR